MMETETALAPVDTQVHEPVIARATEIILSVPSSMRDIYTLHQEVWRQVVRSLAVQHPPLILYAQEEGVVRVRISQSAVIYGRGIPTRVSFIQNQVMPLQIHLAIGRNDRMDIHDAGKVEARIVDILRMGGMEVQDMRFRASLRKGTKRDHVIALPVANVQAQVRILSPDQARKAWLEGLGRGRRFGFGMPIFGTPISI